MIQNDHPRTDEGDRCTDLSRSGDQSVPLPAFAIEKIQLVAYGSKRAQFDVVFLDGLLTVGAELFVTERDTFVVPASIRNRYTGVYERTVSWDESLSAAILGVVIDAVECARK